MTDIIDFEAAKDRRTEREIDADQAQWEDLHLGLVGLICKSGRSTIAVTPDTLRALLDVLEASGLSRQEAKAFIARSLNAFREPPT
jgi:hypothetical protein